MNASNLKTVCNQTWCKRQDQLSCTEHSIGMPPKGPIQCQNLKHNIRFCSTPLMSYRPFDLYGIYVVLSTSHKIYIILVLPWKLLVAILKTQFNIKDGALKQYRMTLRNPMHWRCINTILACLDHRTATAKCGYNSTLICFVFRKCHIGLHVILKRCSVMQMWCDKL